MESNAKQQDEQLLSSSASESNFTDHGDEDCTPKRIRRENDIGMFIFFQYVFCNTPPTRYFKAYIMHKAIL